MTFRWYVSTGVSIIRTCAADARAAEAIRIGRAASTEVIPRTGSVRTYIADGTLRCVITGGPIDAIYADACTGFRLALRDLTGFLSRA